MSSMNKRIVKAVLFFVLLHVGFSLGYYRLSWSVREPIHRIAPSFERFYMRQAFRMWQWWDYLGWTGQDVSVRVESVPVEEFGFGGEPECAAVSIVLTNQAYRVGYDAERLAPLWVAYRLDAESLFPLTKRPSSFKKDPRIPTMSARALYRTGYDRGHMAPNYGITTRYGKEAQRETFYMSNIIAQRPALNRGIWRRLEGLIANRYAPQEDAIWVYTGPIYGEGAKQLETGAWLPSACYKIVIDKRGAAWRVMAFMMEQEIPPYTRVRSRMVSVDEIEERTGVDFFPQVLDEAFEGEVASRLWPIRGPLVWFR